MLLPADLTRAYTTNFEVILRLTADLSHEESLIQWPFEGNCLNWLMGHVTVSRMNVMAMLGDRGPVWDFAQARRYIPNTPPILGSAPDVVAFADIRAAFTRTHARLLMAIEKQTPDSLAQPVAQGNAVLGAKLLFYAQHEAFHAGQIELCRGLVQKPKVRGFES